MEHPSVQNYGKLVRDRIPEIVQLAGATPNYRELDQESFVDALCTKMAEELEELQAASSAADHLEELADAWEVLRTLIRAFGFSEDSVQTAADGKRQQRGGFQNRLWLESVSTPG